MDISLTHLNLLNTYQYTHSTHFPHTLNTHQYKHALHSSLTNLTHTKHTNTNTSSTKHVLNLLTQAEVESSDRSIWVSSKAHPTNGEERERAVTVTDHEYDVAVIESLKLHNSGHTPDKSVRID